MSAAYYTIPQDKVAHEFMEGEVIVIHFATGCYFSLQGSAALIWQWIAAGAGRAEIIAAFEQIDPQQTEEVDAFLQRMVSEGILEESTQPGTGTFSAPRVPYEKPVLEMYKDMQDLMLVDPIHEVDATGWPKPVAE